MGSYYLPDCTEGNFTHLMRVVVESVWTCVSHCFCWKLFWWVEIMCAACVLSGLCCSSWENGFNSVWHVLKKTAGGYFGSMSRSLQCFSTISCAGTRSNANTATRGGRNKSWEICLASNWCSVLHDNKVLSAGNLILSDVANALCQKRLRLMLALSPLCEKSARGSWVQSSSPHPPAGYTSPQPHSQEAVTFMPLPLFEESGAVMTGL